LNLCEADTLEKARSVQGVFNNYAVFYQGKFQTVHLLNEGYLKKRFCCKPMSFLYFKIRCMVYSTKSRFYVKSCIEKGPQMRGKGANLKVDF